MALAMDKDKDKDKDTATLAINAFAGNPRKNMPTGLPFELSDYIPLID